MIVINIAFPEWSVHETQDNQTGSLSIVTYRQTEDKVTVLPSAGHWLVEWADQYVNQLAYPYSE